MRDKKIKELMATVFEIDEYLIDENSSTQTIDHWDSLRHMNLIVALEEEFNVRFEDEEISELINYSLIWGPYQLKDALTFNAEG